MSKQTAYKIRIGMSGFLSVQKGNSYLGKGTLIPVTIIIYWYV